SGTFRLYAQSTGTPISPLLQGIQPSISPPAMTTPWSGGTATAPATASATAATTSPSDQSVVEYTLGVNARRSAGEHWTHSAVVGVDGYRLNGVPETDQLLLSAADSALRAAQGGADRATLRLSTVGRYDVGSNATVALTLTAERSILRQQTAADAVAMPATQRGSWRTPSHDDPDAPAAPQTQPETSWIYQPHSSAVSAGSSSATAGTMEIWRNNTGLAAQLDGSLANRFFMTGGLRLERDEDLAGVLHSAALPMLGVAWVRDLGPVSLKLRSSYGKGIRMPEATLRELLWATSSARSAGANLGPEQQSGIETGFDVLAGRALTLKVTRFDQVASGLVQRVMVAADSSEHTRFGLRSQLQNIGRIGNHGWEMQATSHLGQFSATGAFTMVDSRVEQVANGYTGELRPGDRSLEVPARTASITGTWAPSRGLVSLTAYRAFNWVNYDRLALAQALADGMLHRPFRGADLRQYWRTYPGATHLRATFSRDVRHGVALTFTGDNLLDRQRGEPDNITIIPGRTFSFGVKADF
ncbi:MAG TPA: TonB-dependent receptor, partial [Longimicrobiales bacterium]